MNIDTTRILTHYWRYTACQYPCRKTVPIFSETPVQTVDMGKEYASVAMDANDSSEKNCSAFGKSNSKWSAAKHKVACRPLLSAFLKN